jgi:hypothetical protein
LGLDRLMTAAAVSAVFVAAGCEHGGSRPARLLDGRPALRFTPVRASVVTAGRVLTRSELGRRLDACISAVDRASVAPDTTVVERVSVAGESLTFANRGRSGVFACDAGIDPAGERAPPWCHAVFGELAGGRVLDPRLDVICRDRERRPLAYVFVDPVPGARWVGVQQRDYVELYEVLGGLPVRLATTSGIDVEQALARVEIAQYDAEGRELVRGQLEAAVAG